MKIVFTGGGTGGHFYPIIAIAERVNRIADKENILGVKLYYFSNEPYDKEALFENGITFKKVYAGKMRIYFSIKNFFDMFKVFFGVIGAVYKLFLIYPDVVFGKGGYASFPTLFAAKILGIPVVIHESDCAPGRVNLWASRFARRIAISFKEAGMYFPNDKTAWTGQPVRMEIEHPSDKKKGSEYFKLDPNLKTIFILGGSQGAELINDTLLSALPTLLAEYQVIHQVGVRNFKTVKGESDVILADNKNKERYLPIAFLNALQMQNAAGASDIVVSRAGSTLFEISSWQKPSILIPFDHSNGDHSKKNAFTYARAGCASVIEEPNMKPNILISEIKRILEDGQVRERMVYATKSFHKPTASLQIAKELLNIGLKHEK